MADSCYWKIAKIFMINYKSFAFIAFPKAAWERFQDNFPWQIENHKKQTIMKYSGGSSRQSFKFLKVSS